MSTHLHQLLLLPGNNVKLFCTDGISPLTVMNIQKIYNFGGNIKFKNCGASDEWIAMSQATDDMGSLADNTDDQRTKNDYMTAFTSDQENLNKFENTSIYTNWMDGVNNPLPVMFGALSKHYCGKPYHGSIQQMILTGDTFKQIYCPEQVGHKNYF